MDKEAISDAVEAAIEKKLGSFCAKTTALEDHQKVARISHPDIDFLIESRKFVEALKDTFWKTIIRASVIIFVSIITAGIYAYFKYGKGHVPPSP